MIGDKFSTRSRPIKMEDDKFDPEDFLDSTDREEPNGYDKFNPPKIEDEWELPEWYVRFRNNLFDIDILEILNSQYQQKQHIEESQEIEDSLEKEIELIGDKATINLDKDSEIYNRIIDGHYNNVREDATVYGFLLGKKIEEQRQELESQVDNIRIDLPSHYPSDLSNIESEKQEKFWNELIEYFATETYRQKFSLYLMNNTDQNTVHAINEVSEMVGEEKLKDLDQEQIREMEGRFRRELEEFNYSQRINAYLEPFIEGLAYAKVSEKRI